jgi:transcriptional regulator with XRE-family HTH domain
VADDERATAARVILAMRRVGMTQAELAYGAEMTADKLSKSLHGKRRFSSYELAMIAEQTGSTVEDLLGMKIEVYSHEVPADEMEHRDSMIRRTAWKEATEVVETIAREYEEHGGYANHDSRGWKISDTIRNSWKRLRPAHAPEPPAVQRTADRDTIIEVLLNTADRQPSDRASQASWQGWAGRQADAVLAVLVPADLIRAEALDEAADAYPGSNSHPSVEWLRNRAEAVRKAAGA